MFNEYEKMGFVLSKIFQKHGTSIDKLETSLQILINNAKTADHSGTRFHLCINPIRLN